jgi:hypothetical protein
VETIANIAWAVLIGAGLVAAGALLLKQVTRLRADPNLAPSQHAILDALEPFIWRGILAGEQIALGAATSLEDMIDGWDKAAIANGVYDLLPDVILVGGRPIPVGLVKRLVPRSAFVQAVKDIYDSAHAFIKANEAYLTSQVEALKSTQTPDTPMPPVVLPPGEEG